MEVGKTHLLLYVVHLPPTKVVSCCFFLAVEVTEQSFLLFVPLRVLAVSFQGSRLLVCLVVSEEFEKFKGSIHLFLIRYCCLTADWWVWMPKKWTGSWTCVTAFVICYWLTLKQWINCGFCFVRGEACDSAAGLSFRSNLPSVLFFQNFSFFQSLQD